MFTSFSVGDKVKFPNGGAHYIITSISQFSNRVTICKGDRVYKTGVEKLVKIKDNSVVLGTSESEKIKRVFLFANGWTKEVNEALNKLELSGYTLKIPMENEGEIEVLYQSSKNRVAKVVNDFTFDTQCSKNEAFSSALLSLFLKSKIGKEYNKKIKEVRTIQEEIEKLKEKLDALTNEI